MNNSMIVSFEIKIVDLFATEFTPIYESLLRIGRYEVKG